MSDIKLKRTGCYRKYRALPSKREAVLYGDWHYFASYRDKWVEITHNKWCELCNELGSNEIVKPKVVCTLFKEISDEEYDRKIFEE